MENIENKKTPEEIVESNSLTWKNVLESKDLEKIVGLYSSKKVSFLPTFSDQLITDLKGVEGYFAHFFEQNPKVTFEENDLTFFSENFYTLTGMYSFEVDAKGARNIVHARFTYCWAKEDGVWKIVHHHSSELPKKNHQN